MRIVTHFSTVSSFQVFFSPLSRKLFLYVVYRPQCDGVDLTSRVRQSKLTSLLFLNIPHYASGTTPWGHPGSHSSLSTSSAYGAGASGAGGAAGCSSGGYASTSASSACMSSGCASVFTPTPTSLSGGGQPTPAQTEFELQSYDDGLLEVIGFTATSLAALKVRTRTELSCHPNRLVITLNHAILSLPRSTPLIAMNVQVGGHGERIAQCATVRLRTLKTIPMQIDGEPSHLPPATICIALHSRAHCVLRSKKRPQLERQRGCAA